MSVFVLISTIQSTNGNFNCLLTDCSTFVVCAPLASYTVYICFEKTTTVLGKISDLSFGDEQYEAMNLFETYYIHRESGSNILI